MTKLNYTHVSLVVDRSGSMTDLKNDAQGGINTLIAEQFAEDGQLTVTLSDFDDEFNDVVRMGSEPFLYELNPRGSTALLDAVGKEITRTGEDLAKLPEHERPEKVLFVVVTDGEENASHEFTLQAVRKAIKVQREQYNWVFQFIGADDAAWQGQNLGMQSASFNRSDKGQRGAYKSMSHSLKTYRKQPKQGVGFVMPADIPDDEE